MFSEVFFHSAFSKGELDVYKRQVYQPFIILRQSRIQFRPEISYRIAQFAILQSEFRQTGYQVVILLEIIPPQVTAFGVGAVQDKPMVITDSFGNKSIEARKVLPICCLLYTSILTLSA